MTTRTKQDMVEGIRTAQAILDQLKTVDGPASGLDADTLDGVHAADLGAVAALAADAQTANFTLSVPAGYAITGIYVKNTTANQVTGGIRIGTAAAGTDVAAEIGVGPNSEFYVTGAPPLAKRFFSRTLAQTIHIEAITAWNAASIDMRIVLDKLF